MKQSDYAVRMRILALLQGVQVTGDPNVVAWGILDAVRDALPLRGDRMFAAEKVLRDAAVIPDVELLTAIEAVCP